MRMKTLIATSATSALLLTPALAVAAGGPPAAVPSGERAAAQTAHPGHTPGPHASEKAKRKAYGTFCATESRKRVAGEHGTPFSQCVTSMAKLATGKAKNPTAACKGLSRKHVKGENGTPFSQCVSGAAKLLDEQQSADDGSTPDDTNATG